MARCAWPPPVSPERFAKALREGKRTMEEIDPAFAKWAKGGMFGFMKKKRLNKKLF